MKAFVWGIIVLFLVPAAAAQQGSIKLLALTELSDGTTGGMAADLDLQVEPGHSRVFLETFPLTKITTQISMRFAQQVACKELDLECSNKDFFFTIRALPGIVGGPSAGSAAAVLTASVVGGWKLRNDTVITGTVNSGGIIGPVGGVKEKITAAVEAGYTRALIPRGTRMQKDNVTNVSLDLIEHGKSLGVEVIEVSTLQEAMKEYTGKDFARVQGELVIEPRYRNTMEDVASALCNRTAVIVAMLESKRTNRSNTTDYERNAVEMRERARNASSAAQHYAAASFCFRANVNYKRALALQRPWTEQQVAKALVDLRNLAVNYSREVDNHTLESITDLQTYMAVKERLFDVEDTFVEIVRQLNNTEDNAEQLAYAEERLYSAVAWAEFFNGKEGKFVIDPESLRDSCMAKIAEAEERINYVRSFLPNSLTDSRRELDKAYQDLSRGNDTLCLYKAAKVKADTDVILGLMGVESEELESVIDLKLSIAKDALIKSQQKGIFPIIGYSYYEYALSLRELDKYSTLLFAEYALEFSNLDIYFAKKKSAWGFWKVIEPHITWLLAGVVVGLVLALVFPYTPRGQKQVYRRKPRKIYK
jgi:uncharacterized protein